MSESPDSSTKEKSREPILVAGLGRCGSSLVMQMLDAAGIDCLGEYPAFEDPITNESCRDPLALMCALGGRAVKILDPHVDMDRWPRIIHARVIWMNRNTREQAKSQVKFLHLVGGVSVEGRAWRRMYPVLMRDKRLCEAWLDRCKPAPLVMDFKDLLLDPPAAAKSIASYLGLPSDSEPIMASQVVLPRNSKCQPGLDIELTLLERGRQAPLLNQEFSQPGDAGTFGSLAAPQSQCCDPAGGACTPTPSDSATNAWRVGNQPQKESPGAAAWGESLERDGDGRVPVEPVK